jgi:hypothetical protein
MFVHEDETPITLGKCSTDKKSIPGSNVIKPVLIAFKNNLSPCSKTLLNVIFDHEDNGIFRAVMHLSMLTPRGGEGVGQRVGI